MIKIFSNSHNIKNKSLGSADRPSNIQRQPQMDKKRQTV